MARENVGMTRLALLIFLLWEAYWACVFFNAPEPDVEMDSVFAVVAGVVPPRLVAAVTGLSILGWGMGRGR
jgi:hypothetical protein